MLIGMLHTRKNPEKVSRAYAYASVAKMEGIKFFYFTSKGVDLNKKKIRGKIFKKGKWKEKKFRYPDIIMNVGNPITQKQYEIYMALKKEVPFTSRPVGTKIQVYHKIIKGKEFAQYILPYMKLNKIDDFIRFINEHQKVIIKPLRGHHGDKVIYVEENQEGFLIKENNKAIKLGQNDLIENVNQLCKDRKMLMQKYVHCRRKNGDPYDMRLHVQKNGEGLWVITIIYPKIGLSDNITTNLGQGGQMTILDQFLKHEFGIQYFNIKCMLETFAMQFAKHFDTLYEDEFDELGMDVGIDEDMKIWIYEVNWRPGHKYIHEKAAKNAVLYAKYLITKGRKK